MTRLKQLSLSLLLFALFSSCAHVEEKYIDAGPVVTACVVDLPNDGFECIKTEEEKGALVSFSNAPDLICTSPKDLEDSLKACKRGVFLPVKVCTVSKGAVSCNDTIGAPFSIELKAMDNYMCFNAQDRKRIFDRCTPAKV